MFCNQCGKENEDKALRCVNCGAELHPESVPSPTTTRTSPKAVWALVLGILSIICFGILAGIPAIILGFLAKKDIRLKPTILTGQGMATAGIVLGICSLIVPFLLAAIAIPNFLNAQVRSKVAMAKSELRMIATGLEAYYIDNNSYPDSLEKLTSPIPFITSIPKDPFLANEAEYDYKTDPLSNWVLRSVGPDKKKDADLDVVIKSSRQPELYEKWIFDPTNGTTSSGDILRTGP